MRLSLASKNPEDKGAAGRGERRLQTCQGAARGPSRCLLTFADGPHPNSRARMRRVPAQSRAKTKLLAHPETGGGLSSAPPAAASLPAAALEAGSGARGRGCSSDRGAGGRGRGAARRLVPAGSLPRIYAAPVHVSLSARKGGLFLALAEDSAGLKLTSIPTWTSGICYPGPPSHLSGRPELGSQGTITYRRPHCPSHIPQSQASILTFATSLIA